MSLGNFNNFYQAYISIYNRVEMYIHVYHISKSKVVTTSGYIYLYITEK